MKKSSIRRNGFFKKSFSLTELEMYLVAVGILCSIAMGASAVLTKLKIDRVLKELQFYETALVSFISEYGDYPNLTVKKCVRGGFKKCNTGTSLNADTTIDTGLNSGLVLCNDSYSQQCKIQLFNYGRFLSDAGFIENRVGAQLSDAIPANIISKKPSQWLALPDNDISWYLPVVNVDNRDAYMFYFYGDKADYAGQIGISKFQKETLADETSYSTQYPAYFGNYSFEHQLSYNNPIIMFATIYPRKGKAFLAPKVMRDLDKKIDDGKPRNGKIVGIGYDLDHCDDSNIYNGTANASVNQSISYQSSKNENIGCQLAYQLDGISKLRW